ncbi:hypothetical protein BGW39_001515 [Mortierella sp. 14UC]|nr:hypothetical protein BGW39_001515 [Mortierella sp. 14UC]
MGTNANINASEGQQTSQQQKPKLSPVEIPELLAHIASFLPHPALGLAAQVSTSFHAACTPYLWRLISLDDETAEKIWESHKGFRMGMIRYGRYVEELRLVGTSVQDGDLELIGENFTRLRRLDLSGTNVTEETLRVLIHSDPYGTQSGGVGKGKEVVAAGVKRKAGVMRGSGAAVKRKARGAKASSIDDDDAEDAVEEEGEGLDEIGRDDAVDAETKMLKYREYTETETEYEADSQYESIGIPNPSSTATESEQERPTGSIPHSSLLSTKIRVKGRLATGKIPLHRLSGTTRPAKFKGTKTQFPFYLEELVLNRCNNLTGPSALKLIARLGPQLKKLSLNHVADLKNADLLAFLRHVPQLVTINVKGTDVTDPFLKGLAEMTTTTTTTTTGAGSTSGGASDVAAGSGVGLKGRASLEGFNFDMTNITQDGLVPLIKANRSTLKSVSFEHNHHATDEVLYAFIESPSCANKRTSASKASKEVVPVPISARAFGLTSALTSFQASYCTGLTDEGLALLFKAATELTFVILDGTNVGDESLLALAESYRVRMKRLRLGTPAAWREFELAEDKVLIAAHAKIPSEVGAAALMRRTNGFDRSLEVPKVYQGQFVPGGLRRLSLKHCPKISNRGLRAIVRSCVNLEGLNVSNCGRISVEVFNGPWACRQLDNLMIVGMPLELAPGCRGYETLVKEELAEKQRFPLVEEQIPAKHEFDRHGYYDYIVNPMEESIGRIGGSMGGFGGGFGGWDDDEDENGDDDEPIDDAHIMAAVRAAVAAAAAKAKVKAMKTPVTKAESVRYKFPNGSTKTLKLPPPHLRNTPTQRALLKQFYSKLGLLTQLIYFDMSQCMFRIRPKDGLALALPGLTKSLESWNMYRYLGYPLQDSDLEFFGRYFGYGRKNCPIEIEKLDIVEQEQRIAEGKVKKAAKAKVQKARKAAKAKAAKAASKGKQKVEVEEDEDEDEDEDDEEEEGEEPPRVSKLEELIVSKFATEDDLDCDVFEWFMEQGIDLVQIDDFDYDMM